MPTETLVEYYEQLAEEVADDVADTIKRLIALVGTRPIGQPETSPFEVWANAEKILENDESVVGYAAQFGWDGLRKLIALRDDAARRRGLFNPEAPVQGGL